MQQSGITIHDGSAVIENGLVSISADLARGTYSGIDKADGTVMFRDATFRLDHSVTKQWKEPETTYEAEDLGTMADGLGTGRKLRIWRKPDPASYDPESFLDITLYTHKPFAVLGWGVRNPFKYELRVCRAELLFDGRILEGQQPTRERVLRGGAGAEPNVVESTWKIDALNSAMLTYVDGQCEIRRTVVAGGLRYAEFVRQIEIQEGVRTFTGPSAYEFESPAYTHKGDQKQLSCTAWDPQGKRIPADTLWESSDTVYLDVVTRDPFESLERYGEAMASANGANPNKYDFPTLCGWAVGALGEGTSLNHSPGLVEQMDLAVESGVLAYTPVAVRLEPDFYCYGRSGNTQQGWWDDEHWARYGSLKPPYETFREFADAVKERGGITFTYFQASLPSNDFAVEHPEWMLNNDISRIHVDHAHHKPLIRYDYSDPGFQEYVLAMWKRLREDGVEGIKFDYPETAWARYGGFEDTSYTTTSAYRRLYELCREGLGGDAYIHERILGSKTHENVPRTDVCAGVVDLQRVWGDSSHFEPEMASRIGLRWYKQGKVFRYYPDSKSVTQHGRDKTPLTTVERRTVLTLVGLLCGRFELATSFGRMTPEILHDLTRIYPVLPNGQAFRPVDMLLGGEHPSVYVYTVGTDWKQVILVNSDTENARELSVLLSGDQAETGSMGFEPDREYDIFDFWNQRHVATLKGSDAFVVELQAFEALVYSVRERKGHPRIIGTSRHVMCGMFEVRDEAWDSAAKRLRFRAALVAGEQMKVSVAVPSGVTVATVEVEGACPEVSQARGIVGLLLTPGTGRSLEAAVDMSFE